MRGVTKRTARARERVRAMMVIIFCYKNHCGVAALVTRAPDEIRSNPSQAASPMVY
jgi:hypothetical protein